MAISEFRRRCLRLVEDLPAEGLTLTKRGQPVARVSPVKPGVLAWLGTIPDIKTDPHDDLFSTGVRWDAESRHPHSARHRRK